jgi:hypothetical protein
VSSNQERYEYPIITKSLGVGGCRPIVSVSQNGHSVSAQLA